MRQGTARRPSRAPLFLALSTALAVCACSSHAPWTPKKKWSFPAGSIEAPRWPRKERGVKPFKGYVTWAPESADDQVMILAWQYEGRPPSRKLYRARAVPYGAERSTGMQHLAKGDAKKVVIADERRVEVDGHKGWRFILRDGSSKALLGVSCSWYCGHTGREFFVKCLQGGGRGKRAVLACDGLLPSITCHGGGVDRSTLEERRYKLPGAADYKMRSLRPCVDQYKDDGKRLAFTVYWHPLPFETMDKEAAHGWGKALAGATGIQAIRWKPRRRDIGGHTGWEGSLEDKQGDKEARFLIWHCAKTGRAYEIVQIVAGEALPGASLHWDEAHKLICHE